LQALDETLLELAESMLKLNMFFDATSGALAGWDSSSESESDESSSDFENEELIAKYVSN
jgi:hypothetical protein